jgi:alpha-tubulin suppressor-like RCC1 family protein
VDGGQNKTCGLNGAGLITCWSGGGAGQNLGGLVPVTGGRPESNVAVAVNRFGSLIVGVDEQGMPITFQAGQFTAVSTLSGVRYVDSGVGQVCALLEDTTVKCWGANNYGQLGDNSTVSSPKPVGVLDLAGASDLAVGRNHACVIVTATSQSTLIKCWGLNTDGQLGNGTNVNSSIPVNVSPE